MASVNVTIRMDANDKEQAEKLFSEFGLTMNAAFNMFVKQALREQSIPFKSPRIPISNTWIGKLSKNCRKNRRKSIANPMRN